jgi:hypothetical protein
MSRTAIKPHAPLDATEDERLLARANCAKRARDRGEPELAASYEVGMQDGGWGIRHEVYRLRTERGATA